MATYTEGLRFVQAFNVADTAGTISFTVGAGQYYKVTCIGATNGATVSISLSSKVVFSNTWSTTAPFDGLNGVIIGENTPVNITTTSGTIILFGVLMS